MSHLITLTTDFGYQDNYVGAVKGAILSICRDATIVDISHAIGPQRIAQAIYVTGTSWPYFPAGTVHVAVVDPGVGTQRRALLLCTDDAFYVGPDNGVLSAALPTQSRPQLPGTVTVPRGLQAFELTNRQFFRSTVSNTFHGRDIFGPVAAHLASGVAPESFGSAVGELCAFPATAAQLESDGVSGSIQHVDVYGNLVTDVPQSMLNGRPLNVELSGRSVPGIGRTYGENEGLFALVTSDGWLAVACVNGSAARELGCGVGDPVRVRW